MILHVGLDVVLTDARAVDLDDERPQPMTPLLVLDAKRRRLNNFRVTADQILDLCGKDVFAAGNDHFIVAAAHVKQSGLVEIADVTRRHQAVDDLLVAAAGVTLEREEVADEDPTDLALRQLVAV